MKSEYNKNSTFWKRDKKMIQSDFLIRSNLHKIIGNVDEKIVADLGAGEGYVTKKILKMNVKKVIAVEKSKEMFDKMPQKSRFFESYVGDVTCLDMIKNSSVDLALSIMVYPHLNKSQVDKANKEVGRILKKNGCFILAIPHPLFFISPPKTKWYKIFDKNINYWESGKVKLSLFSGDKKEFGPFSVYSHDLSSTLNSLVSNNLKIVEVIEPRAVTADLKEYKDMWGEEDKKPFYLILKCIKE